MQKIYSTLLLWMILANLKVNWIPLTSNYLYKAESFVLFPRKSGRLKTGNREVCYMKIRRMQSMEYKWCPRQTAESAVRGVYLSTTSEIHKNRNHCFKDFVFSIHLETQKHNWCLVSQVQQYWTVLNRPMFYADVRAKAWSND